MSSGIGHPRSDSASCPLLLIMPALYTRIESRAMRQRKSSVYGTLVWTTATCARTFANNESIFDDLDKTPRPSAFFDDATPRPSSSATSGSIAEPTADELWGRTTVTRPSPLDIWLDPLPEVDSETILPLNATEGLAVPTIEPSVALKQAAPSNSTRAVINAIAALRRVEFNRIVLHTCNVDSPEHMHQMDEEDRCIAALAAAQLPSVEWFRRSPGVLKASENAWFFDDGFEETVRRRNLGLGRL